MLAVLIFVLTAVAVFGVQQLHLPPTAAIFCVLGVTLIGALAGVKWGLAAALVASLFYASSISASHVRFSFGSVEEWIPPLAFLLSAAASALVVGRLKESALAAVAANDQLHALFELGQRLQSAVYVHEIPAAIEVFAHSIGRTAPKLYILRGEELVPVDGADGEIGLARELVRTGFSRLAVGDDLALRLATRAGPVGVLVLAIAPGNGVRLRKLDVEAFVTLLSIAFERCLLLEQASEAELIKRSEAFKTDLLSSVSHDMRTPLSAISASASSLASYGHALPDEVRKDLLATIREQCERLNRYTTNLLSLGRLQGGVAPHLLTECDALEVLGAAISRARQVAGVRGITKRYHVDVALVRADPVMLEQVFYNVLENAVHYSPEDTSISVGASVEDGELLVDVVDEGPGIAAGDEERIFARFYRANARSSHEGSGLGLSIAKGFTEAFGGRIAAQRIDERSGGTRVRICLPLEKVRGAA